MQYPAILSLDQKYYYTPQFLVQSGSTSTSCYSMPVVEVLYNMMYLVVGMGGLCFRFRHIMCIRFQFKHAPQKMQKKILTQIRLKCILRLIKCLKLIITELNCQIGGLGKKTGSNSIQEILLSAEIEVEKVLLTVI